MEQQQELRGWVIRGDQQGRAIGYPTANLSRHYFRNHPVKAGVYVAEVIFGKRRQPAAAVIGVDNKLELHLLNWRGNLYGRYLCAILLKRLRSPRRFSSVTKLKQQIGRDVAAVQKYFK